MDAKPIFFEFTSYKFQPKSRKIFFSYKAGFKDNSSDLFTETVILPKSFNASRLPPGLLKKILQDIHLVLGISYYKLYCAKKIKINYALTEEEANFWNIFYEKGLGEFFYKNKLDPKIFPGFPSDKQKKSSYFRIKRNNRFLAAVSGGKDSMVAFELLKSRGITPDAFFVETQKDYPLVDGVIKELGAESLKIRRYLDKKIFDREAGYYDGHIPVSGIYAFLGIFAGIIYGYSYFVVANEFSSNFGNKKYKGETINHQWSKSLEFENMFQNHVENFISPDVKYFSLLRPFYEIRIAELFAKYKQHFSYFSSCNKNFKINSEGQQKMWCGECPKCFFAFLILSPFLTKEELVGIFGKNLFADIFSILPLRDILGFGTVKPFDCVGTFDESKAAFFLSRAKFRDDFAGEVFLPKIDPDDNRYFLNEHKIPYKIYFKGKKNPDVLIKKVFAAQGSNVPDYLKFLGMKNAYLLGFGKEGEVTKNYLSENFPDLQIGVGDIKTDEHYLEKQHDYDIAVRSPGIAKESVKIPYTTASNIFFSYIREMPEVKIIGVTGTKGKSTTASLIYHILKLAGKHVELLGNIGEPMLGILSEKITKDAIFVLELSSYQLDDIKFSPDIAVITSLFPEHMDYHRGIKDYYGAKKNIFKFQKKEDTLIFDPKNKKIEALAKTAKSKKVYFTKDIPVDDSEIHLVGKHNKENVRAAIAAVKAFDVSDQFIKKAIRTFNGLPHRLEFVGQFSGIKFYDDAISTTPESTIAAIKSLPKIGTIFLGGEDRGYSFPQLEKTVKKHEIKNIVLFPDSGNRIIKHRKGLNILETSSMEEAVKFAYQNTKQGEICLLSCASPSYSLWENFEEKGGQFKFFVLKMSVK